MKGIFSEVWEHSKRGPTWAGRETGSAELDASEGKRIPGRGNSTCKGSEAGGHCVEAILQRLVALEYSGGEGVIRLQKKAGTTLYRAFQIWARRVDFLCAVKPLEHLQQGPDIHTVHFMLLNHPSDH